MKSKISGSDNRGKGQGRQFPGMDRRPKEGDIGARSGWRRGGGPFGYQREEQREQQTEGGLAEGRAKTAKALRQA